MIEQNQEVKVLDKIDEWSLRITQVRTQYWDSADPAEWRKDIKVNWFKRIINRLKYERDFNILACMPTTIDRINYYMLRWMRNDNRKGQRAFRIMNMLRRSR